MKHRGEVCTKAGLQSEDDPFTFVMSSQSVDRTGDVIEQSGWKLSHFRKNPVALFGHKHDFVIGNWRNVRVEGERLLGDLVLAARGTSQRIDEIRALIEQRILKAVSVGLRVLEYVPVDDKDPYGAWRIVRAELLEASVVAVPAQQEALLVARSLGVSRATEALVFSAAGLLSTPPRNPSQAKPATVIRRDYSDLLGAPSALVAERARLRRAGLIE